jgi:hypothetical protein
MTQPTIEKIKEAFDTWECGDVTKMAHARYVLRGHAKDLARMVLDLHEQNRELAMQSLSAMGQAQEAYDAQKKAEAERDALEVRKNELQAKLDEAMQFVGFVSDKISYELNPSNYNHQEVCDMNSDWCEIGNAADATLAKLKGET